MRKKIFSIMAVFALLAAMLVPTTASASDPYVFIAPEDPVLNTSSGVIEYEAKADWDFPFHMSRIYIELWYSATGVGSGTPIDYDYFSYEHIPFENIVIWEKTFKATYQGTIEDGYYKTRARTYGGYWQGDWDGYWTDNWSDWEESSWVPMMYHDGPNSYYWDFYDYELMDPGVVSSGKIRYGADFNVFLPEYDYVRMDNELWYRPNTATDAEIVSECYAEWYDGDMETGFTSVDSLGAYAVYAFFEAFLLHENVYAETEPDFHTGWYQVASKVQLWKMIGDPQDGNHTIKGTNTWTDDGWAKSN